ncbi:MAG: FG-GAP-like repeat-containing protein [Bifidobacteriaceae bacterium]|jgi:hypothetical protein|nr:FG-GAP-like repeat-containing protein [Bifidobacteriaceae bacterium]
MKRLAPGRNRKSTAKRKLYLALAGGLAWALTGACALVPGLGLAAAPAAADPGAGGGITPMAYAPIDTTSKAAVRDAYVDYLPTQSVDMGWTGSVNTCTPGTVSAEAQAATFKALNYFRAMAGLPSQVTENTTASAIAQRTALMFLANGGLNHYPPTAWLCWTNNGAFVASRSNIAWGSGQAGLGAGAQAISAYVSDGGNESTVGHRRWILSPGQLTMGSGSTSNTNALVWGNGQGACGDSACTATSWNASESPTFTNTYSQSWSSPQLVAWPAAGYFPYQLATSAFHGQIAWSLQTGSDTIGFAGVSVSVTKNGVALPITVKAANAPRSGGYGDQAALIWQPTAAITAPAAGQVDTYHVSVTGITGHADLSYDVKLFNPLEATVASVAIGGSAQVGQPLTTTVGTVWPADAALTYQWLRDGTTPVGNDFWSYTPVAADAGHTITVRVTANVSGYTAIPVTATSATVQAAPLPAITTGGLTVTGTPTQGNPVRATIGAVDPADATVTYTWRLAGSVVKQGTGTANATYTPTTADHNKALQVTVTAAKSGMTSATLLGPSQTVDIYLVPTLQSPTTYGPWNVGVSAKVVLQASPADTVLTYTFKCGSTTVQSGARAYWIPPAAYGGRTCSVDVTGRVGTAPSQTVSLPSRTVATVASISGSVVSDGGLVVDGLKLYYDNYTCDTYQDVTVNDRYGTENLDTTGAFGLLADVGPCFLLRVRTASGVTVPTTYGGATAAQHFITPGTQGVTLHIGGAVKVSASISGTLGVGGLLTAHATTVPSGATVTYTWYRGATAVGTGLNYTLSEADRGLEVTVRAHATYTAEYGTYLPGDGQSGAVGLMAYGTVSITGTAKVGSTVTAVTGAWAPAPITFAYQWKRDGVAITGATQQTYTPVAADAGHTLMVTVTGTRTNFTSFAVTSAGVTVAAGSGGGDPPKPFTTTYAAFTLSPDLNGDGRGEAVTIDTAGRLYLHLPTIGVTRLDRAPTAAATGLAGHQVYGPGDWDGDKQVDVITVDASGTMWLRKGNGRGGLGAAVQNGRGWSAYKIVPAGDLNGDKANDMLAIDTEGKLWLYAGNGQGGFLKGRTEVGHGWRGFDLYAAGDLNKDGKADILSVNAAGLLYAYFGKGNGTFQAPVQVGRGWGAFSLAAGADLNGDGLADIIGRNDTTGVLYYYQSKGGGQFAAARQVATGW